MRVRLVGRELVTVSPLDREALTATMDELALEATTATPRKPSVSFLGQVDENVANRRRPGQGGAVITVECQITARVGDLAARGYTPDDGDLVTTIADRRGNNPRTVHWYVLGVHRAGKDSTASRGQLVIIDCATRAPSRIPDEGI